MAGVVALASVLGSQQKVSLFHNLQLKFSNRRPCSNDAAHFENTGVRVSTFRRAKCNCTLLTCPHAKKVFHVAGIDFVNQTNVNGQDRRV